ALVSSPDVATNFIVRDKFWASALDQHSSGGTRREARREYVQNIVDSNYLLCVRGAGNFSYRLYETLSCGRIPLFVNSDCVLPFQSEINWKDYCVWVDEKDVDRVGEIVAAFHDSLTNRQFLDLKRECRELWEDYLSPEGVFWNLYKHFR